MGFTVGQVVHDYGGLCQAIGAARRVSDARVVEPDAEAIVGTHPAALLSLTPTQNAWADQP